MFTTITAVVIVSPADSLTSASCAAFEKTTTDFFREIVFMSEPFLGFWRALADSSGRSDPYLVLASAPAIGLTVMTQ